MPMFTSDPVGYEIGGNVDATCFGGVAAMHRLVSKLGLVEGIDQRLHLLKVHLRYHESDHVLNLAYNVLCGGTRLEDIERLRHDTAYMNALGADPDPGPDHGRRFLPPVRRGRGDRVDGDDQPGPAPVVDRAGPGPARPDRLPGRRRHDRTDDGVARAGHGHVLQGDLGGMRR